MAAKGRGKKRVRIQPGHEARYIEHRRSRKKPKPQIKKRKKNSILKAKLGAKIGSDTRTISELVYRFLERASRQGVDRHRKSNAASQFRKHQRHNRSKKLKPVRRTPSIVRSFADEDEDDYVFPYKPVPSKRANESIEECIYDVLSFGTVMGLLEPVDAEGVVFRVASDLKLFDRRKRKKVCEKSRSCECNDEEDDYDMESD